jgi:predicted dehydrogenase
MKIAIIGLGYWGGIILRNTQSFKKKINYLCAVDKNPSQKKKAKGYKIDFFNNINKALKHVEIVIIATWENTHYQLAKRCLLEKKHVLVEKPLAVSFKEAQELVKLAQKNKVVLMVDHTFLFDKSFLIIKEKIDKGVIGNLLRIDSFRFSPNIFKPLTNVIIDLLPHDLAIFSDLIHKKVKVISVNRQKLLNKNDDNAHIVLKFGSVITNSFLSWTHPLNRREMIFYGSKGIICWQKKDISFDFLNFFEYQGEKAILKRKLEVGEKNKTLNFVLEEFFNSIKNKKEPRSSGKEALPQAKILEQVLKKA